MMNFSELLNKYIVDLNITSNELVKKTQIDASLISRYKNGKRTPKINSQQIIKLANAIEEIANEKGIKFNERVLDLFNKSLLMNEQIYEDFYKKFRTLLEELNININELSKYLNYDKSYLYRIKAGERRPIDLHNFISMLVDYTLSNCDNKKIRKLINSDGIQIHGDLVSWLTSVETKSVEKNKSIKSFLNKLDEFNLDEYLKVIHFDELKIPKIPIQLPSNKYYYGVNEMRNAELDFFKYTVLNKSNEPIFMYSDMPMEEMAEDMDFNKKWMFAIAMSIKKGLHINIIHHLDRPFNELMLGLEAWIPIYMTGQVNPYYYENYASNTFKQLNYVSGNIMLHGECVKGYYQNGRYEISTHKKNIEYAKQKAKDLLYLAKPLMHIYDVNKKQEYYEFLKEKNDLKQQVQILSSLSLSTMSEQLLLKILNRNNISNVDKNKILKYYNLKKEYFYKVIENNTITQKIEIPSKEEFDKNPMILDLSEIFLEYEISYTYNEMIEHVSQCEKIKNTNYNFIKNEKIAFRNIQLSVIKNKYAIVSKSNHPTMHFIIEHPALLDAISKIKVIKEDLN